MAQLQCHICVRKSFRTSWARLWCLPRSSACQETSTPSSLDALIGTGSYWILEKTCSSPPTTPPSPPSPPPITIMSPVQFTVIGCLPELRLFSPARSSLAMSRPSLTNSSLQRRQDWQFLERIIRCCSGWRGVGLLPAGVRRLLWENLWVGLAAQTSRRAWSKCRGFWSNKLAKLASAIAQVILGTSWSSHLTSHPTTWIQSVILFLVGGNELGVQASTSVITHSIPPLLLPSKVGLKRVKL